MGVFEGFMSIDITGQKVQLVEYNGKEQVEKWCAIKIPEVLGKYEISNYGRVRSKRRLDTLGKLRKEKLLRWRKNGGRNKETVYYHVCLCNGDWKKNFKIHQLVAKAFVKGYFDGAEVNHKDGVKSNNNYSNLEWVTHKENCQHRNDTGLLINVKGLAHGRQKLTEEEVTELYLTHLKGVTREAFNATALGEDYGVHGRAILSIYRKESWSWLTDTL